MAPRPVLKYTETQMTEILKKSKLALVIFLFVVAGCSSNSGSDATANNAGNDASSDIDSDAGSVEGSNAGNDGVNSADSDSAGLQGEIGNPQSVGLYQTGYSLIRTETTFTDPGAFPQADKVYSYDLNENKISEGVAPRINTVYSYDDLGRVVEIDNLIAEPTYIEYNDDGSVKSVTQTDPNGSHLVTFGYLHGKLVNQTIVSDLPDRGKETRELTYLYSEEGLLLRTEEYAPESDQPSAQRLEFTLDDLGRVIEVLQYTVTNELFFRHTVSYNDNGNIESQSRYTPDGALISSTKFTYRINSEPTPNIAGFHAIRGGSFLPELNFSRY